MALKIQAIKGMRERLTASIPSGAAPPRLPVVGSPGGSVYLP